MAVETGRRERERMVERWEKEPSERVKPPFEANWLDEFERSLSLSILPLSHPLFPLLSFSLSLSVKVYKRGRGRKVDEYARAGDEYKHGDGKSLLISWN